MRGGFEVFDYLDVLILVGGHDCGLSCSSVATRGKTGWDDERKKREKSGGGGNSRVYKCGRLATEWGFSVRRPCVRTIRTVETNQLIDTKN